MGKLAILELREAGRPAASSFAPFCVELVRDWAEATSRWGNQGESTGFQHRYWLDAWYRAFDAATPLIAIISDTITRRDVALVPLICREHHGVRMIEFADHVCSPVGPRIHGQPMTPRRARREGGWKMTTARCALPNETAPARQRLRNVRPRGGR